MRKRPVWGALLLWVPLLLLTAGACTPQRAINPNADQGHDDATTDGSATDAAALHPDARVDGQLPASDSAVDGAANDTFERIKLTASAGPCPPENDCHGSAEVLSSGLLRVDHFGELPVSIHETMISEQDLNQAIPIFTDKKLVALLSAAEPPCRQPTDVTENIELQLVGATEIFNFTTFCDQSAIVAARQKLRALQRTYLPTEGACTCANECPSGQRCLQSQFGGETPQGTLCEAARGIAQCRQTCQPNGDNTDCPASRPHCIAIVLSAGCCSDASEEVGACCANATATDNTNCL